MLSSPRQRGTDSSVPLASAARSSALIETGGTLSSEWLPARARAEDRIRFMSDRSADLAAAGARGRGFDYSGLDRHVITKLHEAEQAIHAEKENVIASAVRTGQALLSVRD